MCIIKELLLNKVNSRLSYSIFKNINTIKLFYFQSNIIEVIREAYFGWQIYKVDQKDWPSENYELILHRRKKGTENMSVKSYCYTLVIVATSYPPQRPNLTVYSQVKKLSARDISPIASTPSLKSLIRPRVMGKFGYCGIVG